jgi:hypothetical protein
LRMRHAKEAASRIWVSMHSETPYWRLREGMTSSTFLQVKAADHRREIEQLSSGHTKIVIPVPTYTRYISSLSSQPMGYRGCLDALE